MTTNVLLDEAWRAYNDRRVGEAGLLFRKALDEGERSGGALYGLGLVAMSGGDLGQAEDHFINALRRDASNANALFQLGSIAELRGSTGDARRRYTQALALNPSHQGALARSRALSPPPNVQQGPTVPASIDRSNQVTGRVRNMQQRPQFWNQRSVWTFEVVPEGGGRPTSVEVRGMTFIGSISNGDLVRVTGRRRGGILKTKRIENLANGSIVKARTYVWVGVVFGIAWLVFMIFLVGGFFDGGFGAGEFEDRVRQTRQEFEQQVDANEQQFEADAQANCEAVLSSEECASLLGEP
ncbi:MAG: tetratricopeptide repeat protein [Actinomycetota bacterium]|nr:tetratricopeptide repeat protein [Actinomycetota bacterium]